MRAPRVDDPLGTCQVTGDGWLGASVRTGKPKRIATRLGVFAQVLHALAPKMGEIIMNTGYRMFPDSPAAAGSNSGEKPKVSTEQVAFAAIMRGIYW